MGKGWGVFIGGWRGDGVKVIGEGWGDGEVRGEGIMLYNGGVVE